MPPPPPLLLPPNHPSHSESRSCCGPVWGRLGRTQTLRASVVRPPCGGGDSETMRGARWVDGGRCAVRHPPTRVRGQLRSSWAEQTSRAQEDSHLLANSAPLLRGSEASMERPERSMLSCERYQSSAASGGTGGRGDGGGGMRNSPTTPMATCIRSRSRKARVDGWMARRGSVSVPSMSKSTSVLSRDHSGTAGALSGSGAASAVLCEEHAQEWHPPPRNERLGCCRRV